MIYFLYTAHISTIDFLEILKTIGYNVYYLSSLVIRTNTYKALTVSAIRFVTNISIINGYTSRSLNTKPF